MASISDYVLDAALSKLDTEATTVHITSAEATSYANAVSLSLGNSTSLSIGAPKDRAAGGREVDVAPVTDGAVTANGTATHYAIVDATNSRLHVTGALTETQVVTAGNSFSLASMTVGIPDPA